MYSLHFCLGKARKKDNSSKAEYTYSLLRYNWTMSQWKGFANGQFMFQLTFIRQYECKRLITIKDLV